MTAFVRARVRSQAVIRMSSNLLTVLVAIGNAPGRMDLADALEVAGFGVLEAADADAALAILGGQHDICLVVTDIDLPGSMDGVRLAAAVAHGWPSVKTIVASDGTVTHGLPEGSHMLQKPYGRNDVTKAVRTMLAG